MRCGLKRLCYTLGAVSLVLNLVACQLPQLWQTGVPRAVASNATVAITIQAPTTISAGSAVEIKVRTTTPTAEVSSLPVRLLLFGTYGSSVLEAPLVDDAATFALDGALTRFAGQVQLQANWGGAVAQATLQIEPGTAVEPLVTLVGPRSIPADGRHWAMVVTLPQDQFANGVADGTRVTLQILHPSPHVISNQGASSQETSNQATEKLGESANREVIEVRAAQLLTWARLYSRTTTGRVYLAATTGAAHSMQQSLLVVPGPPAPFTLTADPLQLTADGEQLITVRTSPLQDNFGNLLFDGTAITFVAEEGSGSRRTLPAQLIAGKAMVQLQAPSRPGPVTLRAFVLDQASPPLRLDFDEGLALAPITVTVTIGSEEVQLRAGPLLGLLNQYIPDGSEVTFTLQRSGAVAQRITVPSESGFATARVRRNGLIAGNYTVQVTVGARKGEQRFALPPQP